MAPGGDFGPFAPRGDRGDLEPERLGIVRHRRGRAEAPVARSCVKLLVTREKKLTRVTTDVRMATQQTICYLDYIFI